MPPSSSRSKTSTPDLEPLVGRFAPALSVDVEEWYHNCWVPEYVDPGQRPRLPEELDRLLPQLAEEFARTRARATFFVLGEVAGRIAPRLRELSAAGHEIACHSFHHWRANSLGCEHFREEIVRAKAVLEEAVGLEVRGFRAPEWSLRDLGNPRLRIVAEAGFVYDSSLVPAMGAGSSFNPNRPVRLTWPEGPSLVELPPLTWGGALRLPAGGWCGRAAAPGWILAAARRQLRRGSLPLLVVHPWELTGRAVPGFLSGFARFFHEAAREGFLERFRTTLAGLPWQTLASAAGLDRLPEKTERMADPGFLLSLTRRDGGPSVREAGA
ncbi:MAG: polysaccharide deacetylase family protein [Thermoanaerobaculia bacterium]